MAATLILLLPIYFTVAWFPKKQHCYFFVLSTDFIREKWINIILVTTKVYERHFCLDQKKGYVHGATKKFVHATACVLGINIYVVLKKGILLCPGAWRVLPLYFYGHLISKKTTLNFFVLSTDFIREKWINIILVTTKVYERHFCLDQKKGYVHGATKKFVHATACYFCIRNFLI